VVLYLFDSLKFKVQSSEYIIEIEKIKNQFPLKPLVVVINKIDLLTELEIYNYSQELETLNIKLIF
jgi:tRNA modification GTPase